eukprot:1601338-Pyramimonas_sp.AAC.3
MFASEVPPYSRRGIHLDSVWCRIGRAEDKALASLRIVGCARPLKVIVSLEGRAQAANEYSSFATKVCEYNSAESARVSQRCSQCPPASGRPYKASLSGRTRSHMPRQVGG